MHPDREQLAWAAGFFDGEGTTHISRHTKTTPDGRTTGPYLQLQVSVSQTGEECLIRFHRAVGGIGKLYRLGQRPSSLGCRPQTRWQACSYENAQAVIAMLWPFLSGPKREQAADRLREIRAHWTKRAVRVATRTASINRLEMVQ